MLKYQVFPDTNVVVEYINGPRRHTGQRYKESKEFFQKLIKTGYLCMTRTVIKESTKRLQEPPFLMNYGKVVLNVDNIIAFARPKRVNDNRVNRNIVDVENFYIRYTQNKSDGMIRFGGIDRRYHHIAKKLVMENGITSVPSKDDCTLLAEIISVSDQSDKTMLASYDKHFIEEGVKEGLKKEFGIITGDPPSILKELKQ